MSDHKVRLWLIRHGETEWSLSGAHTSRTDIPLTDRGRERAAHMADHLHQQQFSLVLTSPRQRARETCSITGYGDVAQIDSDLSEWDYGEYEGRTTADIRKEQPGWTIWKNNPREGETLAQVKTRAQSIIDRCTASVGQVALFAHAHILRILAATWIGLPPEGGSLLALGTGSVSTLGFERETRVIETWNRSFELE
ncbi:histidine phosphatase family protein [Alloacidobacterium dinghuense]|uniref:Histidine phosphatase family protein n=1 Tax=Alloacidobacterium dinghuense TaxID=2763107 RepID=A0A7G8BFI0_9BACT|nr:histidine phosphatase family protein [Alloacidobacterium dinghuense]QNI31300.1 histidine phosphatase family protein [Alloacidobacterium dinghuense]